MVIGADRSMRVLAFIKTASACAVIAMACGTSLESDAEFSGQAALVYVRTQLEFGPRVPGSQGHRRAGEWVLEQVRTRSDTVIVQDWTHVTRQGDSLPLRNIFARFRPTLPERVLYVAHWDTRPTADNELEPVRRRRAIPGANDGASGVGLLLALAEALRKKPPSVGVDLLFVDGEDFGNFADPDLRDVLIGSQYFVNNLPEPGYRPLYGVVWDMIGDSSLRIDQEEHSTQAAPEVVTLVWKRAERLGYEHVFSWRRRPPVIDDHVPFLRAGLRVALAIDLDYTSATGHTLHHTLDDTLDRLSAQSLQAVGDVALDLVRNP